MTAVVRLLADMLFGRNVAGGAPLLFVEYAGAHECVHHSVRVAVGGRPAVLQVALLLFSHHARYPDAATAVCHSCCNKILV